MLHQYSNAKPLFNLAVLFVIGGVYNLYWYGVNWRLLAKYKNYQTEPAARRMLTMLCLETAICLR
jgi:hypothetical protein